MRLRHVATQQLRRLHRRYPFLRRVSIATVLLTISWLYLIHWGERVVYKRHIDKCHWDTWEDWPEAAKPHHLVFIADPQLVDPHTYPGRPWPLSTLTEQYTDLYMARNFRLMNYLVDPDSIVFLGDLFDGGREWAPETPKELKLSQQVRLEELGIRVSEMQFGALHQRGSTTDEPDLTSALSSESSLHDAQTTPEGSLNGGRNEKDALKSEETKTLKTRSLMSYKAALARPHTHEPTKEEHNIGPDGTDLKVFVPGENGRWSRWGHKQWLKDLRRFSKIFFDADQLYPLQNREFFPVYDVTPDPVSVENGASNSSWQEYGSAGGRQRRVIASLPGNHDVGFGPGVQLAIRDRFQSHFGEGNRVDIIGNHTFVSLDTPSLGARNYFEKTGYESASDQAKYKHIFQPGVQFLAQMDGSANKAVGEALREYYPDLESDTPRWQHEVTDPEPTADSSILKVDLKIPKPPPNMPVVLLSHVPLYRPGKTYCGPLREDDNAIKIQIGYQYQNALTQTLSKDIVTKLSETAGRVVHIFSGDDHNYCDVEHRYNVASTSADSVTTEMTHIREITVKSFSWAMGVRWPGFVMVSLWNPVNKEGVSLGKKDEPTLQTHLCLLPSQLGIFLDYLVMLVLTVIVLIVDVVYWSPRLDSSLGTEDNPLSPTSETRLSLPRFQLEANGSANDSYSESANKRHRRATSTSSSPNGNNGTSYLGVQRSFNARTRSVSPNVGEGPLINQAGYYPQVRWADPTGGNEDDSDEGGRLGRRRPDWKEDSRAKWKWRRRTPEISIGMLPDKVRRGLRALAGKVLLVGVPVGLFYLFLLRNG